MTRAAAVDTMQRSSAIYRHTRREALVILLAWAVAFAYTCLSCYRFGYASHAPNPDAWPPAGSVPAWDRDPATLTTPLGLGIPDWVFYGIILPWLACIGFTCWFCLRLFVDDDLDTAGGGRRDDAD
jgi:hypothetical protein